MWRGYALSRLLARHNALTASLILGPVWAAWHLPKFTLAGTVGSAHAYPFWVFVVQTTAFTVLITWAYVHTRGSLLIATLFHAASNTAALCLPIIARGRAMFIMAGLECLLALAIVFVTGPSLARSTALEEQAATIAQPLV